MNNNHSDGIIIFGSSRSEGDTYQICKKIANATGFDLIDLNAMAISVYDYDHGNADDDFIKLAEEMASKRLIILASPVYWYSMSAQMKTFIDRWSDLVTIRKDLGRKLKGVNLIVISCSNDNILGSGFSLPFSQTAKYMDMKYAGHYHTWIGDDGSISQEVENILKDIAQKATQLLSK